MKKQIVIKNSGETQIDVNILNEKTGARLKCSEDLIMIEGFDDFKEALKTHSLIKNISGNFSSSKQAKISLCFFTDHPQILSCTDFEIEPNVFEVKGLNYDFSNSSLYTPVLPGCSITIIFELFPNN